MFSLESPHRGGSNENAKHTIVNIKYKKRKLSKIMPNRIMSAAFFCLGLKNEFEIALVNEPSVFEPSNFQCISNSKKEID